MVSGYDPAAFDIVREEYRDIDERDLPEREQERELPERVREDDRDRDLPRMSPALVEVINDEMITITPEMLPIINDPERVWTATEETEGKASSNPDKESDEESTFSNEKGAEVRWSGFMGNGAAQIGLQTKSNLPKMQRKEIVWFLVAIVLIVLVKDTTLILPILEALPLLQTLV